MKSFIFAALCQLVVLGLLTSAAQAEAQPKDAILILDASGSMWGQIDGVNKIVIAKEVVEGLVRSLPEDQRLGLVAYGHRKKSDCSDIQTLADVGANRSNLIDEIRALSPVGRTPLSKSIEHSANELNYTKNAATVILVSDGLETCDVDPCALAKTLEENGLDLTVHVIGFDVTIEERKGLQCIADETGGEFLSADNAGELSAALSQVASAPVEIEPSTATPVAKPQTVALKATMLQNGPDIQSQLDWRVVNANTGTVVFEQANAGYVDLEVQPGSYTATAVWNGWPHSGDRYKGDKTGTRDFTVSAAPLVVTVPIDLGIPVSLEHDTQIVEGNPISVRWTGPDDLGAYITVNRVDDSPRDQIYFTGAQRARDAFAKSSKQTSAQIDSNGDGIFNQDDIAQTEVGGPSIEGDYEVRYVLAKPRLILARTPVTVTDGGYTVTAPAEVPAASTFAANWAGSLTQGDFVTIERADLGKAFTPQGNRQTLKPGTPVELTAPAEPGDYEVRYVLANGYTTYEGMHHAVQASQPIKVLPVQASVAAPQEVVGGSTVTLELKPVPGEGWNDDYVSFVESGAKKYNRDSWVSLSKSEDGGNTVQIQAPNIDGQYEVVYFLQPGDKPLARQPVTVTRAKATVDAPETVRAGEDFQVAYTGPIYRGDRIIVAPADVPDHKMWGWGTRYGFAVAEGQTHGTVRGGFKATVKPGEYVVRYVTGLQHQTLARDTLLVTE